MGIRNESSPHNSKQGRIQDFLREGAGVSKRQGLWNFQTDKQQKRLPRGAFLPAMCLLLHGKTSRIFGIRAPAHGKGHFWDGGGGVRTPNPPVSARGNRTKKGLSLWNTGLYRCERDTSWPIGSLCPRTLSDVNYRTSMENIDYSQPPKTIFQQPNMPDGRWSFSERWSPAACINMPFPINQPIINYRSHMHFWIRIE